ncbi:15333_t:CDS:1 [Cetraspora pellucida]|uniref:15333_t:CDS:1 n=1 Tax=Cetraspora pellucida TaxID=1433469 RepID=A0A9N9GMJ6_9GLOM|nr:15333_t:CDS:1 [Cetraspora pellucida]
MQFERKALIIVILFIYIILSVNAQNLTCQMMMCTRPDNIEAIATYTNANELADAEGHMASNCPGVTNIIKCDISCTGPYNPRNLSTYYIWKKCAPQAACVY